MLFAGKRAVLGGLGAVAGALALSTAGAPAQTCDYSGCSNYTPPSGTSPSSGTKPTSVVSGRAALAATHACTKTSFPLSVSGRQMSRVTVYVNGRLVKRITVKSTETRVTTKLPTPVATSKIVVKVTFTSSSGTKPKQFTRTVKRCVPAAVKPSFTG